MFKTYFTRLEVKFRNPFLADVFLRRMKNLSAEFYCFSGFSSAMMNHSVSLVSTCYLIYNTRIYKLAIIVSTTEYNHNCFAVYVTYTRLVHNTICYY